MWSWRRNQGEQRVDDPRKAADALPDYGTDEFTEPNYRRGGPYSQEAVPTYADALSRQAGRRPFRPLTHVIESLPFGTYPASTSPPGEWIGYKQDNLTRSVDPEYGENVINGEEGPRYGDHWPGQRRMRWAMNPYWKANVVTRPQRTPHEWSFVRPFDRYVLGERRLNGMHYSQAQTATDNNRLALAGQVPQRHRRSTFRLEPTQTASNNIQGSESSGVMNDPGTYLSPWSGASRSFRVT